ncbi:sigma-54 interaction domain-containing protein [Caldinitratiruptor microaerophilus]|uniref:HTH-type transcriptional regulatory protein TyrR n=1 Tax=Caldinitratiruptor microaerophilus TaxID=671077 RepID=A0AA35CJ36_9FIRM|nr:sigma 54-interacting transcriptional regulator [Caldinitratiruptor microaerophilus]BDG60122.1 hypothetical protein caldi_12120 [Caldinitratiruptor microaerophilus]
MTRPERATALDSVPIQRDANLLLTHPRKMAELGVHWYALVSPLGKVFYSEGEALHLFGCSNEELVGRLIYDLLTGVLAEAPLVVPRYPTASLCRTLRGRLLLMRWFPSGGRSRHVLGLGTELVEDPELLSAIAADAHLLSRALSDVPQQRSSGPQDEMIAVSPLMRQVREWVRKVGAVSSPVLILGETGVGKEVVARAIHRHSPRCRAPFVRVNCGAIPESLFESALFGYERGAFTGAERGGKAGYLQAAEGGTLFLDEIGELPLSLQVKLLHVLQDRTFTRVGGTEPIRADVRIITATNRDLAAMVREGRFREDLYYRLNVLPIEVPPLRERPEDIAPLVELFLERFARLHGRRKRFSEAAMAALKTYPWPGNVRQLEHLVERLVVLVEQPVIHLSDLPQEFQNGLAGRSGLLTQQSEGQPVVVQGLVPLRDAVRLVEEQLLLLASRLYATTQEMGQALGVSHSTVVRKLKKYTGANRKRRF